MPDPTGGTGLTDGAVPLRHGILLDLKRLDQILEIDATDRLAVVQPGVVTAALRSAVERTTADRVRLEQRRAQGAVHDSIVTVR